MVGTNAVTGNKLMAILRYELVGRQVGRITEPVARTRVEETDGTTRAQVPSRHREVDPREPYRELIETPVRWVRLT